MTQLALAEARPASLELVANAADLRRDLHVFVDFVRGHEIKRGHRDNALPAAPRQRLAKLMSDPATAAMCGESGCAPWIEHVDAVCLALGFVAYDTKGSYAGYSSSEPSFPDNFIKFEQKTYAAFLELPLQEQEVRILNLHLKRGSERDEAFGWSPECEFFAGGPLSRLDRFDARGSALGVVPTLAFPNIRRRLLELLAECPAGVWFSVDSLIEHLRRHDRWFLIPERIPAEAQKSWGKGSGRYTNFVERKRGDWACDTSIADRDPEGFAKVEGRFVERFLEGIPLVLGYTEVGYVKRQRPTEIEPSRGLLPAFRVTERLRPAVSRQVGRPKVTVLPNFEVHVESLFHPAKIDAELLPCSEVMQRGIVTVYRLSKPKVAAVLAENPKASVAAALKSLSGRDLPANVEQELAEWAGHSEKFILYEGFGLLEGPREDAGADGFVVEAISPHFALVRSPEELFRRLEAAEKVPLEIRHSADALVAPAGARSRVAPGAPPPRAAARKPAKIRRSVQTTLWFTDAEAHAAFSRILLDAKCVVPTDTRALTVTYGKEAEPLVKEGLKKLGEIYAVSVGEVAASPP